MMCPVMRVWNMVRCKIKGHPYNRHGTYYELVPVDFTGFFSSGTRTIMTVKCSKCKATMGRVGNGF